MTRIFAVEVRAKSQEAFNQALQERMQNTVWTSGCASWYLDAKGCNTTLWPEFTFNYWRQMRHFDTEHYSLFARKKPVSTRVASHEAVPVEREPKKKS